MRLNKERTLRRRVARSEIGRQRWSAIVRQVRVGLHDDLLPIYGTRGEIGIALWEQAYAHLCKLPGLARSEEADEDCDREEPFAQITGHFQAVARVMSRSAKSEGEREAITFWLEKFDHAVAKEEAST